MGSAAAFAIHKAKVEWFQEVRHPPVFEQACGTPPAFFFICCHLCSTLRRTEVADECVEQTMMSSRPRIWSTMILLSFPFLSVGASTCLAAAGESDEN